MKQLLCNVERRDAVQLNTLKADTHQKDKSDYNEIERDSACERISIRCSYLQIYPPSTTMSAPVV